MTTVLARADAANIPLADGSVHSVVCSPPYWSLRKYSGAQERIWPGGSYAPMPGLPEIIIPGDANCEHQFVELPKKRNRWGLDELISEMQKSNRGNAYEFEQGSFCSICGAWRGGLGLEPTPEMYVWHLLLCFEECRRVLRDDGVMWCVIGDSYSYSAASTSRGSNKRGPLDSRVSMKEWRANEAERADGLAPGQLIGIPWRLAFALQAAGWTVRRDVIWSKVAPMPESVAGWRWQKHRIKVGPSRVWREGFREDGHAPGGCGDRQAEWSDCPGCEDCAQNGGYVLRRGSWRHTASHEYVLMCVKQMGYWADQEAVRESSTGQTGQAANFRRKTKDHLIPDQAAMQHRDDRDDTFDTGNRNPRDVLSPSCEGGFSGDHYAVFPKSLIRPLIEATTPRRCCPKCGTGWSPVVERIQGKPQYVPGGEDEKMHVAQGSHGATSLIYTGGGVKTKVLSYRPSCTCGVTDDWVPGVVLDPFCGSGTVQAVARELGLRSIGLDLSHRYLAEHAVTRTEAVKQSRML